jgi:hypothetical protein
MDDRIHWLDACRELLKLQFELSHSISWYSPGHESKQYLEKNIAPANQKYVATLCGPQSRKEVSGKAKASGRSGTTFAANVRRTL